eukprot:4008666-Pyramimonas_sp.AAC.1
MGGVAEDDIHYCDTHNCTWLGPSPSNLIHSRSAAGNQGSAWASRARRGVAVASRAQRGKA